VTSKANFTLLAQCQDLNLQVVYSPEGDGAGLPDRDDQFSELGRNWPTDGGVSGQRRHSTDDELDGLLSLKAGLGEPCAFFLMYACTSSAR
jgi:hypothetical protein